MVSTDEQRIFMNQALKDTLGYDVKTLMLYRASRDGWHATDYHKFCDDKGSTVTLIMTTNNVLCGGFLKIPIKSGNKPQK